MRYTRRQIAEPTSQMLLDSAIARGLNVRLEEMETFKDESDFLYFHEISSALTPEEKQYIWEWDDDDQVGQEEYLNECVVENKESLEEYLKECIVESLCQQNKI